MNYDWDAPTCFVGILLACSDRNPCPHQRSHRRTHAGQKSLPNGRCAQASHGI